MLQGHIPGEVAPRYKSDPQAAPTVVGNGSTRTVEPVCVASTITPLGSTTNPTWVTSDGSGPKKTRSPGCSGRVDGTGGPTSNWSWATLGRVTPAAAHAACARPEQSNPSP